MPWPSRAELLQGPPPLDADPSLWSERIRWLGRYALGEELERWAAPCRQAAGWDVQLALDLSLAHLLAGQGRAADLAFLEAHHLGPSLGLLPDPWGLWPPPAGEPASPERSDREAIHARSERFGRWRWLEPSLLWSAWRESVQSDWTSALQPEPLDQLALLLRQRSELDPPIEQVLPQLVGDGAIAADPFTAFQFWGTVAELAPHWDYARIKAADLALAHADLSRCDSWLAGATETTRANPWFWDISARRAVQAGEIATALDHWGQAMACGSSPPEPGELERIEVFRQRRRDARRGPGLLQARSLLHQGAIGSALTLLQRLVEEDPQWQPLRTLLEQARAAQHPQATPSGEPASDACGSFGRMLDRAAARIGITLPPVPSTDVGGDSATDQDQHALENFSRFLSHAEGRFALNA